MRQHLRGICTVIGWLCVQKSAHWVALLNEAKFRSRFFCARRPFDNWLRQLAPSSTPLQRKCEPKARPKSIGPMCSLRWSLVCASLSVVSLQQRRRTLYFVLRRSPRRSNSETSLEDGEIRQEAEPKERVQPADALGTRRDAKRSRAQVADAVATSPTPVSTQSPRVKRSSSSDGKSAVPKKKARLTVDLSQLLADGAAATQTVLEVREQERREKARLASGPSVSKPGMRAVKTVTAAPSHSQRADNQSMVERMRGESGAGCSGGVRPASGMRASTSGACHGAPAAERTKLPSHSSSTSHSVPSHASSRPVVATAPQSRAPSQAAQRGAKSASQSGSGPPSKTSTARPRPRALL
jgi:hypothetical protein